MSGITENTWITPIEAGRLVAAYLGPSSVTSGKTQVQLLEWVLMGKVRAMALERTRCEDEPPAAIAARETTTPPHPSSSQGELPAFRVNGAFRPGNPEDAPLLESQSTDYVITVQDWQGALNAGTQFERFWSTSELTHRLPNQRHPFARVEYAGIRLAKEDVERRIAIAGWVAPIPTDAVATTSDTLSADPPLMKTAWSEAQIDAAIVSCGYQNREEAWREYFKPRRAEHGWDVEAFRSRWSAARNTKGMKGRPSGS